MFGQLLRSTVKHFCITMLSCTFVLVSRLSFSQKLLIKQQHNAQMLLINVAIILT